MSTGWLFLICALLVVGAAEVRAADPPLSVVDFGAIPSDGNSDTANLAVALAAAVSTDSVLFFPAGVYEVSGSDDSILLNTNLYDVTVHRLELVGEPGAIIRADCPNGEHYQTVARFYSATLGMSITGLEFDANECAGRGVAVEGGTYAAGNVEVTDCTFRNGLQLADRFGAAVGLKIKGPYDSVQIVGSSFHDFYSARLNCSATAFDPATVVKGLLIQPNCDAATQQAAESVLVDTSHFEGIRSATQCNAGGVFVSTLCNAAVDATASHVIRDSVFIHNDYRSIKTQARNGLIQGNHFTRSEVDGRHEIDAQYGGVEIRDNQFFYDGYRVEGVGTTAIRTPGDAFQFTFVNNEINLANVVGRYAAVLVKLDNDPNFPIEQAVVSSNSVDGSMEHFVWVGWAEPDTGSHHVEASYNEIASLNGAFLVAKGDGNLAGDFRGNTAGQEPLRPLLAASSTAQVQVGDWFNNIGIVLCPDDGEGNAACNASVPTLGPIGRALLFASLFLVGARGLYVGASRLRA